MKVARSLFLLILLFCLPISMTSFARDTDLYMASGEGVEPNILIIFDNSGSMNDEIQTRYYDPAITYDPLVVPGANRDTVYYRTVAIDGFCLRIRLPMSPASMQEQLSPLTAIPKAPPI